MYRLVLSTYHYDELLLAVETWLASHEIRAGEAKVREVRINAQSVFFELDDATRHATRIERPPYPPTPGVLFLTDELYAEIRHLVDLGTVDRWSTAPRDPDRRRLEVLEELLIDVLNDRREEGDATPLRSAEIVDLDRFAAEPPETDQPLFTSVEQAVKGARRLLAMRTRPGRTRH